jgi:hypothetical protein
MAQGDRFYKVFIQRQETAACSSDLGNKLDMEHAMGDVIIFDQVKHLCFVDIAGISMGVEDSISIKGETLPVPLSDAFFLAFSNRLTALACPGRQVPFLSLVQPCSYMLQLFAFVH